MRPDLVVTLADGKQIVVDAKVPFTGYIEAVQATDQAVRDQRVDPARTPAPAHVDALAARRYPHRLPPGGPFTVLFVPSDGFLTTALEAEPGAARVRLLARRGPGPLSTCWHCPHGRLLLAPGGLAQDAEEVLEVDDACMPG